MIFCRLLKEIHEMSKNVSNKSFIYRQNTHFSFHPLFCMGESLTETKKTQTTPIDTKPKLKNKPKIRNRVGCARFVRSAKTQSNPNNTKTYKKAKIRKQTQKS